MPKPKCQKVSRGSNASSSATPASVSPATPLTSAPGTPANVNEDGPDKKRPRKQKKGAEEQLPLQPIQKARDMSNKLLKKKNEASTLALTLSSAPFAEALSNEMAKFAAQFE